MSLFGGFLFNGGEPPVIDAPLPGGSLGRFQLGNFVQLSVSTVDSTALPVVPDAAPVAVITDQNSVVLATIKLAMMGGSNILFGKKFFLGYGIALGIYTVAYSYDVAGAPQSTTNTFQVIDGGDAGGRVISMTGYLRPEANYIVAQLDSGNLVQGRNPRL